MHDKRNCIESEFLTLWLKQFAVDHVLQSDVTRVKQMF